MGRSGCLPLVWEGQRRTVFPRKACLSIREQDSEGDAMRAGVCCFLPLPSTRRLPFDDEDDAVLTPVGLVGVDGGRFCHAHVRRPSAPR